LSENNDNLHALGMGSNLSIGHRTEPARRFLQTLADQKEDAVTAQEAAAGLKRVEQRK
jgi:hypothetical protein